MAYQTMYGSTVYDGDFDEWPNANVRTKSVYVPDEYTDTSKLDPLTAAILTPHKLYMHYRFEWVNWYNWYAGTFIAMYLHRHIRERLDAFKSRQNRVYYWNYVEEIVDLYGSFIFSKGINRTFYKDSQDLAEQEMLEKNAFWENIDLHGTGIDAYMRKIFNFTQIFNFVDVVVDMPKTPVQLVSEQERLDAGIRPYVYHILPFNAINWERDAEGNFLWYRYRELMNKQYNPFALNNPAETWHYTTWTRQGWTVHEVVFEPGKTPQAVLVDVGATGLGEVPVVRFYGKKDLIEEDCGLSVVSSLGKINVAITNYLSLVDEDIYGKVLNLLLIQNPNAGSDDLDPSEQGTPSRGGLELGTNNALEWSGEYPPQYLSPAAAPGEFILNLVSKCIDEMYKLATLWTDSGIRESRSGVSYSYEFNRTNNKLADKADLMEEGEKKVHQLYSKWLGEVWTGDVEYPDTFDVETIQQELDDLLQIKKAIRSPTLIRELEKWLSTKLLVHSTTQVMQKVITEIDTLPSLEEQASQQALVIASEEKDADMEEDMDDESESSSDDDPEN